MQCDKTETSFFWLFSASRVSEFYASHFSQCLSPPSSIQTSLLAFFSSFTFMSLSLSQWISWLMAAVGELWPRRCVFMSCSSSCRAAGQVGPPRSCPGCIMLWKADKYSTSNAAHRFSASHHISHDGSNNAPLSLSPLFSPRPRRLGVCQQLTLLPVDPGAAVHQPRGSSSPLFPPALPLPALAPGPQNRRRAEKHRPRHLLHQQPAQVRWHRMWWRTF